MPTQAGTAELLEDANWDQHEKTAGTVPTSTSPPIDELKTGVGENTREAVPPNIDAPWAQREPGGQQPRGFSSREAGGNREVLGEAQRKQTLMPPGLNHNELRKIGPFRLEVSAWGNATVGHGRGIVLTMRLKDSDDNTLSILATGNQSELSANSGTLDETCKEFSIVNGQRVCARHQNVVVRKFSGSVSVK